MSERRSKRTETEDVPPVDHLLDLLREVSSRDPSSAIRERLATLAAERLHPTPRSAAAIRGGARKPLIWLRPALAAMVLAAVGLTAVLVLHFRQHEPIELHGNAPVNHPAVSAGSGAEVGPTVKVSVAHQRKAHRARQRAAQTPGKRQMTLRLPYSNSAIETGTDTTIRVSMSQSGLLSLGFPINATVQDRRIVAELTLGDDGLPRAISLPLPLEVMKEKK
jgi:hypothetical protein